MYIQHHGLNFVTKYNVNENYFEKLDTCEKAYILGFIYADGYNSNSYIRIVQNVERVDVLQKIANALDSNIPIKDVYGDGKVMQIEIHRVKLCQDLTKLGAWRNKSLNLKFPSFIPDDLMSSFILGYFDGDGCVWDGKRKKLWVKNERKPGTKRERIVHNVKFTFTGNVEFISKLQEYLVSIGIVNRKTKLNFSKANNPDTNTCQSVCTMEYSGRRQMKKLYDYMYSKSPIWCQEKRNKFDKIFCALEEQSSKDTSLIAETPEMVISSQASDNSDEGSSTIPEMGVAFINAKCEAPE